ncbi:MAG: restriction endonuclease subunit S [Eubacterium sp.]|nr:restriction endonuclease subunit S [Eubacterium sp.]
MLTFSGDVGQQRVTKDYVANYLFTLPPLNEQQRILNAVHTATSLIESIEKANDNLIRDIDKTKAKILDLAIRGKLVPQDSNDEPASVLLERIRAEKEELIKQGKIKRDKKESVIFKGDDNSYYQDLPETWELVNFKDCATLISGRDLNKNEYNAESIGIPYITGASNFINENILINRWTTVPKIVSEVNDILITCKGTVGELAINKYGNIHIARQIMAIRIYKNINLEYIKFFLESIVMEIKKTANGLIPGISRDDILSLNIPLPPLAEQKRIVDEIEKIFATLDDIANQVA